MRRELGTRVSARLAALRALYVAERDADARDRLARERPPLVSSFADDAARRLAELRALCTLAQHLHSAMQPPADD